MVKVVYILLWILEAMFGIGCVALIAIGVSAQVQPNEYFSSSDGRSLMIIGIVSLVFILLLIKFTNKGYKVQKLKRAEKRQAENTSPAILEFTPGSELPIVPAAGLLLAPQEVCHICMPAQSVKLKQAVVGYSGGHGSMSVRVARGVTLRTGSSRGTPIRDTVMEKYPATLYVTNRRIVLVSPNMGFDKPIDSLTAISPYSDTIILQFGATAKTIAINSPEYVAGVIQEIRLRNG